MKKEYYYAVLYEIYHKRICIMKSEKHELIEAKIRSFARRHSAYCFLQRKEAIDKNQIEYIWSNGGDLILHSLGERWKIYFHKSKINKLPELNLEEFCFLTKDPIMDAMSVIRLDDNEDYHGHGYLAPNPYVERNLIKKSKVKFVPIKTKKLFEHTVGKISYTPSSYDPW